MTDWKERNRGAQVLRLEGFDAGRYSLLVHGKRYGELRRQRNPYKGSDRVRYGMEPSTVSAEFDKGVDAAFRGDSREKVASGVYF